MRLRLQEKGRGRGLIREGERKFEENLDYVHAKPVKRGLVLHPKDWPWSSWAFYWGGEEGLVRIDVAE